MKTVKLLSGCFFCLLGIILILHFSDMNPLWYWKGYIEWFGGIVEFINPQNGFLFLFLIACVGVVFVIIGDKMIARVK